VNLSLKFRIRSGVWACLLAFLPTLTGAPSAASEMFRVQGKVINSDDFFRLGKNISPVYLYFYRDGERFSPYIDVTLYDRGSGGDFDVLLPKSQRWEIVIDVKRNARNDLASSGLDLAAEVLFRTILNIQSDSNFIFDLPKPTVVTNLSVLDRSGQPLNSAFRVELKSTVGSIQKNGFNWTINSQKYYRWQGNSHRFETYAVDVNVSKLLLVDLSQPTYRWQGIDFELAPSLMVCVPVNLQSAQFSTTQCLDNEETTMQKRKAKAEAEAKAKAEAEAKSKAEAEAKAKAEAEAKARAEAEAKARAEAEAKARAEAEAKARAEAEAKARAEAEAKARAEAEAKARAKAEAKAKASSQKSITCVKGKSSLKVVGKNPKCPKGYKKKK